MINTLLKDILNGDNIRQNLSKVRAKIKDSDNFNALRFAIGDHLDYFIGLLKHEDAKTRKNAALLMGDLADEDFLTALFEGYTSEETLFVKGAYLTALASFDCSPFVNELKSRINELSQIELTDENRKHISEELRGLNKLIIMEEGVEPHTFVGYSHPLDCIFLTNKLHKELLEKEISELQITGLELIPFLAGVRVQTNNLYPLLDLRSYSELLIAVPELTTVEKNPTSACKAIMDSGLIELLKATHKEEHGFHFRIEIRSKMALSEKSAYAKKLAGALELASGRKLINSTSNYEIELRLIENKLGTFNVLLKLNTLADERFAYRTQSVAASIRPTSAAQLVALAKDYMVADAQVLDPFCGVGTMLIERQMVVKANTSYGIDFYSPAIEKARVNMENAEQIIHFVNRNFFDFTHEYKFDEIFTNMPFITGHKSEEEIEEVYEEFFPKAKEVLKSGGRVIMLSHNADLVRELSLELKFEIVEEFTVSVKEGTSLFVIDM